MAPPWERHPGFTPADPFWRQSGEHWLNDVWRPFFDGLTEQEQRSYRTLWTVPAEWWDFYLDPGFQAWLESSDEP